jgi:hypothetical protein
MYQVGLGVRWETASEGMKIILRSEMMHPNFGRRNRILPDWMWVFTLASQMRYED